MAFLKRSKSQKANAIKAANATKPLPPQPQHPEQQPQPQLQPQAEDVDAAAKKDRRTSRFERRRSLFGRSKSADPVKKGSGLGRSRIADGTIDEETPPPEPSYLQAPQSDIVAQSATALAGDTIPFHSGDSTFNFPTPSPRLPPPRKSATFQSSPSRLAAADSGPLTPAIGVAIGSPTHGPPSWGRTHTVENLGKDSRFSRPPPATRAVTQPMATAMPEYDGEAMVPELRKKKSGWKTLGGLFGAGRKGKVQVVPVHEPFYKVQMPRHEQQPAQHQQQRVETWAQPGAHPQPSQYAQIPTHLARPLVETPSPSPGILQSPGSISTHHQRTPSVTRGMARFEARAEADRLSFMPMAVESKMLRTQSATAPGAGKYGAQASPAKQRPLETIRDSADLSTTLQAAREQRDKDQRTDSPMSGTGTGSTTTTNTQRNAAKIKGSTESPPGRDGAPRTPRLDLDIPNGEMERYSVMFGNLLEPRQSILERRQSKARAKQQQQEGGLRKDLPATPEPRLGSGSAGVSPVDGKLDLAASASAQLVQRVSRAIVVERKAEAGAGTGVGVGAGVVQRSATTPQLRKVPSLRVTVAGGGEQAEQAQAQEQRSAKSVNRPHLVQLQRSKTAPPGSVSPVALNFSRLTQARPATIIASAAAEDEGDEEEEVDMPSPTSLLGEEQNLPPTPTTSSSRADSRHTMNGRNSVANSRSAHHLSSPTRRTPAYPRIKSPEDLERQIVQVSVARQVSVSRARRQVEKAVTTKQPLKPRVVELSGREKGRRPKSTHVVLISQGEEGFEEEPMPMP